MPFVVLADGEFYTTDAQKIVDSSTGFAESIRGEYAELEKQILAIDPGFSAVISKNKYLTDEQKLTIARSYLAQKAFDYYRDAFMAELEQRSAETGRKIVTKQFTNKDSRYPIQETFLWLDRGEIDDPKCHLNNDVNDFETCFYPDGFEDYVIDIEEYKTEDKYGINSLFGNNHFEKSIDFEKDIPDKNARVHCSVMLGYESLVDNGYVNKDNFSNIMNDETGIDVACTTYKYDEYYAWLHQEIEDTRNGKHDVIATKKLPDGTIEIVERQSQNMSAWKSNTIPGAHVYFRDFIIGHSEERHRTSTK